VREVFRVKGKYGRQLLAGWLSWASHSRIPEFVALARSIRRYRELIHNTLDHGLSNARCEVPEIHTSNHKTTRPDTDSMSGVLGPSAGSRTAKQVKAFRFEGSVCNGQAASFDAAPLSIR
jgi:Transposase